VHFGVSLLSPHNFLKSTCLWLIVRSEADQLQAVTSQGMGGGVSDVVYVLCSLCVRTCLGCEGSGYIHRWTRDSENSVLFIFAVERSEKRVTDYFCS